MPNPFNSPPRGSLNWGADRIRRLLDREEQERSGRHAFGRSARSTVEEPTRAFVPLGDDPASDPMPDTVPPLTPVDDYGWPDFIADVRAGKPTEYEKYVAARAALSETVGSQLPGREAGPADAYRHILWAAEMTRRFGADRAREMLDLHEREGEIRGQQADDTTMDISNNEIGIQIGIGARTYGDVINAARINAARKVISGSVADGLGSWKPDYDPTSTITPYAAQWLPEERWANNPRGDAPPTPRVRFPPLPPRRLETSKTNWYLNPNHPGGPDWQSGYVPDGYDYPFGDVQHATGPDDSQMFRARDAYQFFVDHPWLAPLKAAR